MPDLSNLVPLHSGQVLFTCPWKSTNKENQYNFIFHILINYYELTCCIENNVDPDLDLHCLQES